MDSADRRFEALAREAGPVAAVVSVFGREAERGLRFFLKAECGVMAALEPPGERLFRGFASGEMFPIADENSGRMKPSPNGRGVSLRMHQWRVDIASDSRAFWQALENHLPHYLRPYGTRKHEDRLIPISVRVWETPNVPPSLRRRDPSAMRRFRKFGVAAKVDFVSNRISVFLDTIRRPSGAFVYHHGFLLPLFSLIRKWKAVFMHASLVARDRKGVLIAGKSRAGKSTLTIPFLQNGFQYLSDENPILTEQDSHVVGKSVINKIGLSHRALENFPLLRERFQWNSETGKYYIHAEEISPGCLGTSCTVKTVIFPRFRMQGKFRMRRLATADLFTRCLEDEYFVLAFRSRRKGEKQFTKGHIDLLSVLATSARGFLVDYGLADIESLPERLACL
jgi:hypothetical protein